MRVCVLCFAFVHCECCVEDKFVFDVVWVVDAASVRAVCVDKNAFFKFNCHDACLCVELFNVQAEINGCGARFRDHSDTAVSVFARRVFR